MYKCTICMFETNRNDIFIRHQSGKKHLQKAAHNAQHHL